MNNILKIRRKSSQIKEGKKIEQYFAELKKNLSRQVEKKIKKYLTELEKKENLSRLEKEKIEQYLKKIEESLHKLKKKKILSNILLN